MTSQRSLVQIHYRPPRIECFGTPEDTHGPEKASGDIEDPLEIEPDAACEVPGDAELQELVVSALPSELNLAPIEGFKMNLSANSGFRKVFFARHCDCGTAALLSVEVEQTKTIADIRRALPSLVDTLGRKSKVFDQMGCEGHRAMRMGSALDRS